VTTRWPDGQTALRKPAVENGARRRRVYEDLGARISILAGKRPPRPDTLKQTDQPPISTKPLADGAGHTFELGEDLLDGVEVGRVFRQEDEAGSDIPDRLAHRLSPVGAEIVEDHDVARLQRRDEELFDIGVEALAVDGPVEQAGRVDAVVAQGGEESRGLPLALRDLVDEALSLGAQPRRRVILVFVQVSSMKTSRLRSMSP
jgi:hypothetical protein